MSCRSLRRTASFEGTEKMAPIQFSKRPTVHRTISPPSAHLSFYLFGQPSVHFITSWILQQHEYPGRRRQHYKSYSATPHRWWRYITDFAHSPPCPRHNHNMVTRRGGPRYEFSFQLWWLVCVCARFFTNAGVISCSKQTNSPFCARRPEWAKRGHGGAAQRRG